MIPGLFRFGIGMGVPLIVAVPSAGRRPHILRSGFKQHGEIVFNTGVLGKPDITRQLCTPSSTYTG